MDLRYINTEVLPRLKELIFPTLLIGDKYLNELDVKPFYPDILSIRRKNNPVNEYEVLKVIHIKPKEQYEMYKSYFETANFSGVQKSYIFESLDVESVRYSLMNISENISASPGDEDFNNNSKQAIAIKKILITGYELFKKEVLNSESISPPPNETNKKPLGNKKVEESSSAFKIALLDSLGVLKYIKESQGYRTDVELKELIAVLLDTTSSNISSKISNLNYKSKHNNNNPYNPTNKKLIDEIKKKTPFEDKIRLKG